MAAVVGALRVDLGLNSAQFQNGLKNAQGSMSNFSNALSKGLAGAMVGVAAATAAMGAAVAKAFGEIDTLGKKAQSAGVPVEEFSKLAYVADLSGTSVDALAQSMTKLSVNMTAVAGGAGGQAAQAFKALGISVKDSNGNLKTSTAVTEEVADKFAGFRDSASKTALAVALFGRAGADLVPYLNQGGDAIRKGKDEAAAFGLQVSGATKDAVEGFNDNLSRLGYVVTGVARTIAASIGPALKDFTDGIVDWVKEAKLFEKVGDAIDWILKSMSIAAATTAGEFRALGAVFSGVSDAAGALASGNLQAANAALSGISTKLAEIRQQTQNNIDMVTIPAVTIRRGKKGDGKTDAPIIADASKVKAAADEIASAYDKINEAGKRLTEQMRTPAEKLTNELGRLQDMLAVNAISVETHARAVEAAHAKYDKALVSMKAVGDTLGSGLTGMWDDFIDGTLNAAESIKKLGQSMLKMIGNKLIMGMMDNLFGGKGGGGGLGGIFGSLFAGGGASASGFGGLFAAGGNFAGGKPIIVGERGPELITPRSAGTVIPNHELGGPASAAPVNVVVNNTNGSQVGVQETQGPGGTRQLEIMIEGVIGKSLAKNGGIAQQLQGMYGMKRTNGRG